MKSRIKDSYSKYPCPFCEQRKIKTFNKLRLCMGCKNQISDTLYIQLRNREALDISDLQPEALPKGLKNILGIRGED